MSTVLANTITAVGGGGSTVKVNNDATFISDGGAVTNSNLVQGLCKAWARLNPNTLQDSFNTASILDNGTGDFEFNYTNNMGNANYSVVGDGNSNAGNTGVLGTNANAQNENSTSLCRFIYSRGNAIDTASDPGYVYYQLVGDLA